MELHNSKHSYKWNLFLSIVVILAMVLGTSSSTSVQAKSNAVPAAAPTNTLELNVISARTDSRAFGGAGVTYGDSVTEFKYIINIDNTGITEQRSPAEGCTPSDPGYPDSCNWTSVAGIKSSSPIFTQGDQDDFNGVNSNGVNLPDGRYLISVLADGYKLDGKHFTVPLSGPVTVAMQPFPLPDATIRAMVFEDNAPSNSAPDMPAENGLSGFVGHISDYIGEVTTDVYGNPLCTRYEGENPVTFEIPDASLDADMLPVAITGTGGQCVSDENGELAIPHLGPGRYALVAVRPDSTDWIQTTTLEGNQDWDWWLMEGATGYDTEFVVAGEPFPVAFFGFVQPTNTLSGGSGEIKGLAMSVNAYWPPIGGGITGEPGLLGANPDFPIDRPWVALSDLNGGDTAVYIGQGNPDGTFSIPNVPDGDYALGVWDEPQNHIFNFSNVSVQNGETVDLGLISMMGWWTTLEGYVFNDANENGKMDAGEEGIPNFPVVMRKRDNTVMDRGAVLVPTDASGYYYMENAYPLTQWFIEEAYADGFRTTGITFQADNQPEETTVLGSGVDVNVLPIIGLGGRLDWGVKAYDPGTNGGIVGTVSYDTTRNELDPSYAAVEDWQPGVPNITVNLYKPVACPFDEVTPCDPNGFYALNPDGSYAKGDLLNQVITETWEQPTGADSPSGCVARDLNGTPFAHGVDEDVLPLDPNARCLEAPMMGVQFGPNWDGENFAAAVDGNYGFGDGCFSSGGFDPGSGSCVSGDFSPLTPGDYLVEIVSPTEGDAYGADAVHPGQPLYQVTREEDINIGNGDQFIPQVPPPACVGALHTVDVATIDTDGYPEIIGTGYIDEGGNGVANGVTVPASEPTINPTFADLGGTLEHEGQPRPLCDTKLVPLGDQRSIAPTFNLFTDVPIPGRFSGLIVDDLNFSSDPKSILYGEKAGVPFAPVGIYDYANRLLYTAESDYNGIFDVLMPSTNRINCPTPSGVCAGMYRFVGNDPGVPGRWNANYNPQFRTIAAEFEAFPGALIPTDLAPTQVGVAVQIPGSQTLAPVMCTVDTATPQLFAVDKPYADLTGGAGAFNITGLGFGSTPGQVLLNGVSLPTTSWSDTQIAVTVPANTALGSQQLSIQSANGRNTVNGLTFHVLSNGTVGTFPSNGILDTFERNVTTDLGVANGWADDAPDSVYSSVDSPSSGNGYARVRTGGSARDAWMPSPVYGADQEAFFTFIQLSSLASANEQGLLLKYSGGASPNSSAAQWIAVTINNDTSGASGLQPGIQILSKSSGTVTTHSTITGAPATFAAGDQLGVRTLSDGSVSVYKNGVQIGIPISLPHTAAWTGRIGVRFDGVGTSSGTEARFDDFGGGNITTGTAYMPSLFEVGPGKSYSTIQSAIDAAAAQDPYQDSLVVVYPGLPGSTNPRYNGRGAYYENVIMYAPVKLQGVGPGGVYADNTPVQGSIIDGIAFGGDTPLAENWRTKIQSLTWDGNQNASDGQVIYILASDTGSPTPNRAGAFGSTYKASIDGFDLRGGDQMGFPGNLSAIFGPGLEDPNDVNNETQGGAIFVNAYARNLQITNNTVQNNGGAFGTLRIGTPNLPAPDADQQNDNIRIANNRIFANAGTNLAGGIALFNGAENYEIVSNDICGNFSAEYGGGISHYGLSPNGSIHDNRIYFNRSYDEGAGIMIAGELPIDPLANYGTPAGPQGSGPVNIYNNLIQGNLADDDGGGLRFLMAGNFPMNIYNNMIVNNVSTHLGGGIALDDAPNVRLYNNTVMKNITSATAVTSNGQPMPAGLATGLNSTQLQNILPGGSPLFSNPLLFNNILWDNRSGTRGINMVNGIGAPGDALPINNWDMGTIDGSGLLAPTNTMLQVTTGTTPSGSNNVGVDPLVVTPYDIGLSFTSWRTNVNFIGAILVTADLPPELMGDYHITSGSAAVNSGAASKTVPAYQQPPSTLNAPTIDIDNQTRPANGDFDKGADEFGASGGGPPGPGPSTQLYLSLSSGATLPSESGSLSVDDEDIVSFNGTTYSMFFDGSDVGVSSEDINGFAILDVNNTVLLSFTDSFSLSGVGTVDDSDIVQFTGTFGSTTSGTFSMYFDGSAVGLTTGDEDVDAFELLSDGSLIISTVGNFSVTGASGADEDLVRCAGTFGATTSCTWSMHFDGSDVGLADSGEDVDTVAVASNGDIYLSTDASFSVPGVSGVDEDVFIFTPSALGASTSGTYSSTLFFNGSDFGLADENVDGIELP